jgi:hypothetical protein
MKKVQLMTNEKVFFPRKETFVKTKYSLAGLFFKKVNMNILKICSNEQEFPKTKRASRILDISFWSRD